MKSKTKEPKRRGRKPTGKNTIAVNVSLPPEQHKWLRDLPGRNVSRALQTLVREAMEGGRTDL